MTQESDEEKEKNPESNKGNSTKDEGRISENPSSASRQSKRSLYSGHNQRSIFILQCVIMFLSVAAFSFLQAHSEYPKRASEIILQGEAAIMVFHHLIFIITGYYDWNSLINGSAMLFCITNFVIYLPISVAMISIFNESIIHGYSYTIWYKGERYGILISAYTGLLISFLLIAECGLFLIWYQKVGIFENN